jgi:hypothetical protein
MRTPRRIFTLILLGLVLGSCGSGPTAGAWAATVCQALGPWRNTISSLTERAQQQMAAATTPAQAKENLVHLFGGAEQATETARARIEAAGVPDVDGGEAISREFVGALTAMRDAYGRATAAIDGLATGDATAFYDGVEAAMTTLNEEYARSALDTTKISSLELRRAFDEVPECQ